MLTIIILDIISIYQQAKPSSLLLIWPAPYPKAIIATRQINNIKTSVALGDGRCWNAPLPCTDPVLPLQIELRDKEIKYGFKPSK